MGKFAICGDFNSRIADLYDYIEGIDNIKERNVIDLKKIGMETIL